MTLSHSFAVLLAMLALASSFALSSLEDGSTLSFAWVVGLAFGLLMQRSRFCFYCHTRDWVLHREHRGVLAILLALAVGIAGYTVVLGSWMQQPTPAYLPPDIFIGPVSWVLVLAGLAFGAGMVISGSCISAHWYRLAEGSRASPFALIGTAIGFMAGYASWNRLYTEAIVDAPVVWLPAHLGYGGAILAQFGVLALLAAWVWSRRKKVDELLSTSSPATLKAWWRALWQERWPAWVGGLGVGLICFLVVIRMRPLGVTASLGHVAREGGEALGVVPTRLLGLDVLAGCATIPQDAWLNPHALILYGLVIGALVGGLGSGQFKWSWPSWRDAARGLTGGVLLGWGAMVGLGCSIGTLLSGISAGALSGWVFGASMLLAVVVGVKLQRRLNRGA